VAESLVELGTDLTRMFGFGPCGVTCTEELLTALAVLNVDPDELDQAVAPFAPRGFRPASDRSRTWRRTVLTRDQEDIIRALHPFDRRRMAYLRSGEVDLSRIDEVSPKLFRGILGKSRDELEQMFMRMERELPRSEARTYVHAAFNLQRHFASLTARTTPEALDQERHDEAFLREFCAIDDDASFGFGLPDGARIYLRRYAWLHFDFDFPARDGFQTIFQRFMDDFRRLPPKPRPVAPERVMDLFGLSMDQIRSMSRREFARVFRKKAMTLHPDRGGDHDVFVELLDVYKRIVTSKPETR
jgi:hypothetical protein